MKIIDPSFEVIIEDDADKKIKQIIALKRSAELPSYTTSNPILPHLLEYKRNGLLKHINIVLSIDADAYTKLHNDLQEIHTILDVALDREDWLLPLVQSLVFTEPSQDDVEYRYLVSGSLLTWINELDSLQKYRQWLPYEICEVIREVTFNAYSFVYREVDAQYHLSLCEYITDCATLTDYERMRHEALTILFETDQYISQKIFRTGIQAQLLLSHRKISTIQYQKIAMKLVL